jgi:hypothetical protein
VGGKEFQMSLRRISPRSVEWYELLEGENEGLAPAEVMALRTMKALEDVEIRIALARLSRQAGQVEGDTRLAFRFPSFHVRHA